MEYTFDFQRIFFGDHPVLFAVEIALRTTILYLYALLLLRIVGKRGTANLSYFELAIVIALGSAIGDPMFYDDVPLLHGMVVVTLVVGLHRGVVFLTNRSGALERMIEGRPVALVKDGRIDLHELHRARLSREEMFMELRHHRVEHLGQVKWAFLENDGDISLFEFDANQIRPGLRIVPPWSIEPPQEFSTGNHPPKAGFYTCISCGEVHHLKQEDTFSTCSTCDGATWIEAMESKENS